MLARHPKADLLRYLDGRTEGEEKSALEKHLAGCAECREYLSFVKGFNQGLVGLSKEEFSSAEPCPDSWTLVAYEAGEVDEETARHLRAHLLLCDECAIEFYALRRLSREESWRELIERLKESVVDLAKSYGPGALIGPIRIVAEQPALAVRGGEVTKGASKVLELQVGDNAYSVELALTADGSVSFDIAGTRTPAKTSLNITVCSGTGEELISARTDKFGNAQLSVPAASLPDDLAVLTVKLEGREQQLLLRLPETQRSA